MKQSYIALAELEAPTQSSKLSKSLKELSSPLFWLLARKQHAPGLDFHRWCMQMGAKILFQPRGLSRGWARELFFAPMQLTRYCEFEFVWRRITMHSSHSVTRYLDISSPRMFPLRVCSEMKTSVCVFLNPDETDLQVTKQFIYAFQLESRCQTAQHAIAQAAYAPGSFDVITSISVLEHIADVQRELAQLWHWLCPGGKLVITLPCAAVSEELYINFDHYGLVSPTNDGFYFFERIYDDQMLERIFFSVLGIPTYQEIYGETTAGFLRQLLKERWVNPTYALSQEPLLMAKNIRQYNHIHELPGEGVIGLEFIKQ